MFRPPEYAALINPISTNACPQGTPGIPGYPGRPKNRQNRCMSRNLKTWRRKWGRVLDGIPDKK